MFIGHFLKEEAIPMSQFNPANAANIAKQELEKIKEPRRRQILQNFIEHAEAESQGQYAALMASCSQQRQSYAVYGTGSDDPEANLPQSYEALTHHYRGMIEANVYVLHMEVEKLIVGDDDLVIEGIVHILMQGAIIQALYQVDIDDPEAVYMVTRRTLIIFVFDEEGLGCGEHAYTDGPTEAKHVTKILNEEVPDLYWNNPLTSK